MPEPQARARWGCWSTLSSYLRFLPSRVTLVVELLVSLGTEMMPARSMARGERRVGRGSMWTGWLETKMEYQYAVPWRGLTRRNQTGACDNRVWTTCEGSLGWEKTSPRSWRSYWGTAWMGRGNDPAGREARRTMSRHLQSTRGSLDGKLPRCARSVQAIRWKSRSRAKARPRSRQATARRKRDEESGGASEQDDRAVGGAKKQKYGRQSSFWRWASQLGGGGDDRVGGRVWRGQQRRRVGAVKLQCRCLACGRRERASREVVK